MTQSGSNLPTDAKAWQYFVKGRGWTVDPGISATQGEGADSFASSKAASDEAAASLRRARHDEYTQRMAPVISAITESWANLPAEQLASSFE